MKVFISWSGNKSHKVAMVFRDWLPSVIQSIEPYVSSEDIDKGARWSSDIAAELEDSTYGILCVTDENLNAPWLSFEAGALSKTMDKSLVSPFLFGIKRSEVDGPILQFQSTIFQKDDIRKLVNSLNKACAPNSITEARLTKAFEVWYPTLEDELNKLKDVKDAAESNGNDLGTYSSEILEEVLELARSNQKLLRNPDTKLVDAIEEIRLSIKEQRNIFKPAYAKSPYAGSSKLRMRLFEDIIMGMHPKLSADQRLLFGLSYFQQEFPWLLELGRDLVGVYRSKASRASKEEKLMDFRHLLRNAFEVIVHNEFSTIKGRGSFYSRIMDFTFHALEEMGNG